MVVALEGNNLVQGVAVHPFRSRILGPNDRGYKKLGVDASFGLGVFGQGRSPDNIAWRATNITKS